MSVVVDSDIPLLDVAVMDSVPWVGLFNTSQSLFHHVKLELKPAGFHPAFICASLGKSK